MPRHLLATLACFFISSLALAQTREEKVRNDRQKVEKTGYWIYNDLPRGFAEAKSSGKPLIVVLRCIPCEECVKLDDELIDQHPAVAPLLDKFVRVRQISTNGLDLATFQYDYDQSFAVFLLNAEGKIYGRFGTRSHRTDWHDDVSIDGLGKAMQKTLDLHAKWPAGQPLVEGKRGPAPEVASPEKFPELKDKYGPALATSGEIVKSCIHCHQVGEALKSWHREKDGGRLADKVLFPYPHPKSLGLILDPRECATVERVEPESPAAKAGFETGDVIESLGGQIPLSIADVQWFLHHVPAEGGPVEAVVTRGGAKKTLTMTLAPGWRRKDDIAWRASSWTLRRWGTGGIFSEAVPAEERASLKLEPNAMALRIKHVGQYPPHNVAQKAGFQKGDILVSFDGRTDLVRETDLLAYAMSDLKPGARVEVGVLRDGGRKTLSFTLPE